MRVITGKAKGTRLFAPKGNRVRPTTDKIKESIFNIINYYIYDSIFIDCFAGSGSMGIEALSRGAKMSFFIDNNRESINLINKNLQLTRLKDNGKIVHMDVIKGLKNISENNIKADVIFMDPPYHHEMVEPVIESISKYDILSNDGIIVVEHEKNEPKLNINKFILFDSRKYGNTIISLYKKEV